jgi:hypothetical protein
MNNSPIILAPYELQILRGFPNAPSGRFFFNVPVLNIHFPASGHVLELIFYLYFILFYQLFRFKFLLLLPYLFSGC